MGKWYLSDTDRIVRNVVVDKQTQCWDWQLGRDKSGYGRLSIKGKVFLAHRIVYEILAGPLPSKVCVIHTCGNPSCVNPEHLTLGNHRGFSLADTQEGLAYTVEADLKPKMSPEKIKELKLSLGIENARASRVVRFKPGAETMSSKPSIVRRPAVECEHIGVGFGDSVYWVGDLTVNSMGLITVFFWDTKETYSTVRQAKVNRWVLKKWEDSIRGRRPQV